MIVPLFLDSCYNFLFIIIYSYLKIQEKCYMKFICESCYQVIGKYWTQSEFSFEFCIRNIKSQLFLIYL